MASEIEEIKEDKTDASKDMNLDKENEDVNTTDTKENFEEGIDQEKKNENKRSSLDFKNEGNDFFRNKEFQKSIECFTKAIEIDPTDHVLYSNRSGAYACLYKYKDALDDAEKCISLKRDWPKGYSRKGLALFNMNRVDEAKKTYEEGLKYDSKNKSLLDGLQEIEESEDQLVDLQATLAPLQAIQKNKKLKQYAMEDPEYATKLTNIIKQIQKNPEKLKLILAQPDIRIKEGIMASMGIDIDLDDDKAPSASLSKTTDSTKRKEPEIPKTEKQLKAEEYKNKGNELYRKKLFEQAIEQYDKALEVDPTDITFRSNKAAVYMEMGEFDRCIKECEEALEKRYEFKSDFSKVAKVYNRLASCYARMKEFKKAIEMYEKSLCEDNNRHTRAALAEVKRQKEKDEKEKYIDPVRAEEHREKGNEYFKACDFPNAKKEYDEAIRRNPKDAKLYSNRAAALTKLFEYPSALKDVEKALELDPKFVKAWSRKGNLHILMKEYHKALQAFDNGLKIDPNSKECMEGRVTTVYKISDMQSSNEIDEEQMRHSLADPEIQAILKDPQVNLVLQNIQENPSSLKDYIKDLKIKDAINKLITAGILRVQ